MEDKIIMSVKESNRISVIEQIIHGKKKQKYGAKELNISTRQIRRLIKKYKTYGLQGLVHKGRGKASNHKMALEQENKIIEQIRKKYYDFGPTFASEKLLENEKITISKEKLRQIMIKAKIWIPKPSKSTKLHQMRERRAREGELIQIDGSPHAWFEDRGEKCCLIVFIDDATSKLKELHFCKSETTNNYFITMKSYIKKYGRPLGVYADRHSIFKINYKTLNSKAIDETKGLTQFGRAMKELEIILIPALSPQAKGRVERANQTLQDRLVKELRLENINTIEEANEFAKKFIKKFNEKFAVMPRIHANAHKELNPNLDLETILAKQYKHKISKDLEVRYDNKLYKIKTKRPDYTMKKQTITISENNLGKVELIYKGKPLDYTVLKKQPKANQVLDSKELNVFLDDIIRKPYKKSTAHKPHHNHPWKLKNINKKKDFQLC